MTMKNSNPLISVITVSYNAQHIIEKTILSIINQTYKNIEYIIIDGGSTDGTIDVIKKYDSKITHWISEPDKGIYDAMNKGIKLAKGEWINFMNCGDSFYSIDTIRQVVDKLLTTECIDIVYGNTIIKINNNKYIVRPEELECISNHLPFCHQCAFVQTSLAKKHPFDLKYKFVADYNFFYQQYHKKKSFLYINYPIANYQIGGDGFTANNVKECINESFQVNGETITLLKKWEYVMRSFLLKILPYFITNYIRKNIYKNNPRFIIIK